ncbi:hypothetical protein DFH08DRAFT_817535 [Mycena albidolilacea]|uniref:Uncharacterized protein n=1 Tax=Mycena albidolilacea TaxID=1033008 RepID=A0AAD7EGN4_9AGAR|nr:hypothetical protein DFH08DRAFT_817535 [Mycena albidolilacea]
MSLEVVEGDRDGSDGGGDGVNSCGVGLLCNARAGHRADPALRRPPPPSAACTAAHIAARPAALLCALLRRASASARLANSAPSHLTPPPVTSTAKDSPWNEAKRTYPKRPCTAPLPSDLQSTWDQTAQLLSQLKLLTQLHAPVSLPVEREHSLNPTDPLLPKKSTMPGSHPNQIPGDLFTPEANKTSAEPLESPETPSHPSRLSWMGSQNMEGDLAMVDFDFDGIAELSMAADSTSAAPTSTFTSAAPPAQPRIARFSLPGVQTLADEESDDEDELEASPAQPTTAMHFEGQIGGGKWKEPPIERTPTKLCTKVTLTERVGQELRESAKSRAAAGEAALAAAAAAPADNTVADLVANALADPLPHPDDHRGLMSLPPTALNEFLSRVGRAPTFVERVVPGSGEPYDARFNRFLEVGGFAEEPLPPPPPGHRIAARAAGSSRHASPAPAPPASPPPAPPAPRGPPPPAPPAPRAPLRPAPRPRPASLAPCAPGPVEAFSAPAAPPLRSAVPPTADEHDSAPVNDPPSAPAADSPAASVADSSSADIIPPAVDVGGRPMVQQRREMDECISAMRSLASACTSSIGFTEERVLRAFVKNANVTSVSPRRGNAWNLYQAYSHSDEHEKAEYARALRVKEDLEDGEESSTQQWQLTYDDFYLELGEENAHEILVTFGQLRHLGAQTHAQRARLFSKLFRNQEKVLLRTFENHGFEGCTILAGPILNEDAQVAKVSFTPGMKVLPATLRMTEGDFLGACKLTAYSNQMGVINDLAGRSLPESASTACSIYPSAAPVASAPVKTTMQVDDRADFPFGADSAAAAGPSTSVVTKQKFKPPANYDGLTSGEKAALQKRLAKERVGKLDSRKDQLRVRLAQASIADVGFNAFLKQNGGGFLWTSLGWELLKRRVRIIGYPVGAHLPAQTKARKGSSAWRILDLNAFNRALQARSSAGHGLRLEKIPDSVPMGKGKEAGSTIVIATHDYNVPVPPGPISAVVARMRSSMGVAMPVMDGLDKMWMASFDLEKQQVPIRPAAFTDADALRLETAAMAQGGNEDDEDFEDGDVEDDGEEDDGDRDDGDGDDEDEDGDGNEDEAPLPKTSKRVVGKRKARDSDYESEEETIPPPRKSRTTTKKNGVRPAPVVPQVVPIEPRVTRAKASAQVGGGAPTAHAPRPAPKKARVSKEPKATVSFASDVDDDLPAQQPAPKKARMLKEPKAMIPLALDKEDNVPIASLSRPRPAPTKPSRRVVSSPESAPHTPPPATSYRPVVEVPWHPQISPLHRNTSHARPSEAQVSSMVSVLINGAELSTTPTASVDPPAGDNPFQSGPTDRKSAKRRRAPATSAAPNVGSSGSSRASVDPPAGDNPFQSGPTDRKSAKRRRAPATSAAPDVGSSGSSARLRGPATPAVAPAATTHAPAGSAIPPRPRSRTTAASGAMRAPAAPSATFAPAAPATTFAPAAPVTTFTPATPATSATAAPAAAPAPGGTDTALLERMMALMTPNQLQQLLRSAS